MGFKYMRGGAMVYVLIIVFSHTSSSSISHACKDIEHQHHIADASVDMVFQFIAVVVEIQRADEESVS